MSAPDRDLQAAVTALGAPPMPVGKNPQPTITDVLAALSGGDLPEDAVREERCLRPPIGCGRPLIGEDGSARVFWYADEAARYKAEWEITGLCPGCQDRIAADEDGAS